MVGLKADGTVVAFGYNYNNQCDVSNWKNIIAIAAGNAHTVGLKSDGTVVAVGDNNKGQCTVSYWEKVVAIAACENVTVALTDDGRVHETGIRKEMEMSVFGYETRDIVSIAAHNDLVFGLKSDGTILRFEVSYFENRRRKTTKKVTSVNNLSDIVDIVTAQFGYKSYIIGLNSDGTVSVIPAYTYENDEPYCQNWTDIVAIAAGANTVFGLKTDGTVVSEDYRKGIDVSDWKLFRTEEEKQTDYSKACTLQESGEENKLAEAASIFSCLKDYKDSVDRDAECNRVYNELKSEREAREKAEREESEAREKAEKEAALEKARQEKIASLNSEKAALQTELANLKGLFTGKRRRQIEARLAEIDSELKSL